MWWEGLLVGGSLWLSTEYGIAAWRNRRTLVEVLDSAAAKAAASEAIMRHVDDLLTESHRVSRLQSALRLESGMRLVPLAPGEAKPVFVVESPSVTEARVRDSVQYLSANGRRYR
jgi:hypothetical protein